MAWMARAPGALRRGSGGARTWSTAAHRDTARYSLYMLCVPDRELYFSDRPSAVSAGVRVWWKGGRRRRAAASLAAPGARGCCGVPPPLARVPTHSS